MEMAESVDNPKTSQSIRGCRFPNFEMLDAKIASALTKRSSQIRTSKGESAWKSKKSSNTRQVHSRKSDCLHDQRKFPSFWRS